MPETEADTCRIYVLPKLYEAGWTDEQINEQHTFTDGRVIGHRDRVDVILTNPPFGGEEEAGIRGNFPADKQTSETALLFLQLILRKLKRPGPGSEKGGRAGVVVPNGTLFGDGVCARIKRELLTEFNLHTVVRLPNGVLGRRATGRSRRVGLRSAA